MEVFWVYTLQTTTNTRHPPKHLYVLVPWHHTSGWLNHTRQTTLSINHSMCICVMIWPFLCSLYEDPCMWQGHQGGPCVTRSATIYPPVWEVLVIHVILTKFVFPGKFIRFILCCWFFHLKCAENPSNEMFCRQLIVTSWSSGTGTLDDGFTLLCVR